MWDSEEGTRDLQSITEWARGRLGAISGCVTPAWTSLAPRLRPSVLVPHSAVPLLETHMAASFSLRRTLPATAVLATLCTTRPRVR